MGRQGSSDFSADFYPLPLFLVLNLKDAFVGLGALVPQGFFKVIGMASPQCMSSPLPGKLGS